MEGIALAMAGQHQVANASLAIMASLLLQKDYPKVTPELIKDALAHSPYFYLLQTIYLSMYLAYSLLLSSNCNFRNLKCRLT